MKASQLAKWLSKADELALVLPLRTEYHEGLGIGNVYDGDGEVVACFDNVRHAQLVVTLLNAIYGEAKPEAAR